MLIYDIFLDRIESNGIIVGTNNGDDAPVGIVFTQLAKIRVDGPPGAGIATELWSIPISLRLTDAVIYRKSVPAIPRGWGVGLRLEGAGLEEIADALHGTVAGEFIHLRVADAA